MIISFLKSKYITLAVPTWYLFRISHCMLAYLLPSYFCVQVSHHDCMPSVYLICCQLGILVETVNHFISVRLDGAQAHTTLFSLITMDMTTNAVQLLRIPCCLFVNQKTHSVLLPFFCPRWRKVCPLFNALKPSPVLLTSLPIKRQEAQHA